MYCGLGAKKSCKKANIPKWSAKQECQFPLLRSCQPQLCGLPWIRHCYTWFKLIKPVVNIKRTVTISTRYAIRPHHPSSTATAERYNLTEREHCWKQTITGAAEPSRQQRLGTVCLKRSVTNGSIAAVSSRHTTSINITSTSYITLRVRWCPRSVTWCVNSASQR